MVKTLARFEVIQDLKKFWTELGDLTINPDLQQVKREYFQTYTMTCWNYLWKSLLYYLLLATCFVFAGYSDNSTHYIAFPIACMIYVVINVFIQKTKKSGTGLMIYFSFFYVLITNVAITKPTYQYDEGWSVTDMLFVVIAISFCLEWRRIVCFFIMCKGYYIASIYYAYGSISFTSWFSIIFEVLVVCIITIALSKIVLSFIEINIRMKHLLKNVRKILEVFPESVLIESFDLKKYQSTIKFINNTARKEFFTNQGLKDSRYLNLNLKVRKDSENDSEASQNISEFLRTHIHFVKQTKQEISSEIKVTDDDSENKYFKVKSLMVEWEQDKRACMHVFTDTTNVKKLGHEKTVNKCLHLMFSSVSHEFRTPLNAFKHAIEFMRTSYNELKELFPRDLSQEEQLRIDEIFTKFYKIASISSSTLMFLVEDILDLAKIKAGSFALNINSFKIQDLAREIEFIFGFQCAQKRLGFQIRYEDCDPETIAVSDIRRVKQVLMNLISNSYKFTQRGSITLSISEKRQYQPDSLEFYSCIQFRVEDTGLGISQQNQQGLFKVFGKLKQINKKINHEGTGLGLSICK